MADPSSWLSTIAGDPSPWFGFLRSSGPLEGAQQRIEMEERPGVDGFLVFLTGVKPDPFSMQTESDVASRADAMTAYVAACGAVGTKKVFYKYGQGLGQVVVMKVTLISITPANAAVNGMLIANGANGFVLTLQWTLRGVA